MQLQFQISSRQLFAIVKMIIVLNIIMLIGTWAYSLDLNWSHFVNKFIYEFNLASENVLAAWYSSIILFLSAIMSVICFLVDERCFATGKKRITNFGWLIFALLFALLSLDELGSIHENIGDTEVFKDLGEWLMGSPYAGWTIFTFVIGVVSLFMFAFSVLRLWTVKWAFIFMILGLLCYVSNPFQENFEIAAHAAAANPDTWQRPVFFTLLEEGSEILGSLFFFLSTVYYVLHARRQPALPVTRQKGVHITFTKKAALNLLSLIITGLILGMLIIRYVFGSVVGGDQVGVPKNWFTSIISFLVALYGFYVYKRLDTTHKSQRTLYLVSGILGLLMSIYFGCNMYSSALFWGGFVHSIVLNIGFALIIIPAIPLFAAVKNRLVQIGAGLFFIFLYLAFFTGQTYTAEFGILAFCSLLYTLVLNVFYLHNWKTRTDFSLQ